MITTSHVLTQLKNLRVHESADISAQLLRKVAKPLIIIYNKSIQIPLDWKKSNMTPVHKGDDTFDLSTFHPISVIAVMAKILKKLTASQFN